MADKIVIVKIPDISVLLTQCISMSSIPVTKDIIMKYSCDYVRHGVGFIMANFQQHEHDYLISDNHGSFNLIMGVIETVGLKLREALLHSVPLVVIKDISCLNIDRTDSVALALSIRNVVG